MQLPEIERLCRAVVPGAGSIELKSLGAGLISETYRVARDGVAYTLKVAAEQRPDLGVDLPWEVRVLERAAGAGLAPRLVYCDLDRAILLSRWVEGRSWVSYEAAAPANLERIAALLRRVHTLAVPMPARPVTPLQWMEIYACGVVAPDFHHERSGIAKCGAWPAGKLSLSCRRRRRRMPQ